MATNLLNSRRLFYFFHVARMGSFTAAEAHLDTAQSALSRQIRQLEAELGTRLLERSGHGVELTETGTVLYEYARQVLELMGEAFDEVHRSQGAPHHRVVLAAPTSFSTRFFPVVLRSYAKRFPQVHISVFEASNSQIYEMLTSGMVDLAVVLYQANSPKVVGRKLFDDQLVAVGRAGHPQLKVASLRRDDLPKLKLILPASTMGTRELLERYASEVGITLEPVLRLDNTSLTLEMIRGEQAYCTIMPRLACAADVASGEFVAVPLRPRLQRTLHLSRLRNRRQTDALRVLGEEIVSAVRAETPGAHRGEGG
jgi:LysR family nitrogen assimilation transcriptional regulator